ncbi:hypothetical protein TNCV_1082911 [Trichonephila clavipes]|nr:hypothetical protein TNCV_1082911 [Trichonephila clavipes]
MVQTLRIDTGHCNNNLLLGPWVAWCLEHRTPDREAWVRCPRPPNTLRVHMEYVLVKSVGPMGDLTYDENADMHYMYGCANGNHKAALQMYHAQFPGRQMPDHRIFQGLHRQLRETGMVD